MIIDSFNFDEWLSLAQSAPDVFEQRRREQIEQIISNGGNTRRLRGLQCRIDMERIRAHTSMKACLKISSLMWESFLDCNDALDAYVHGNPQNVSTPISTKNSRIIYFPRKN
jgi:hypothetical protein